MSKSISTPGTKSLSGPPIPKSKRGLKGFFKEVVREIKKVNWPTPKETNRLTGIVLVVCGLIVAVLSALSFVIDTVVTMLTKGAGS